MGPAHAACWVRINFHRGHETKTSRRQALDTLVKPYTLQSKTQMPRQVQKKSSRPEPSCQQTIVPRAQVLIHWASCQQRVGRGCST